MFRFLLLSVAALALCLTGTESSHANGPKGKGNGAHVHNGAGFHGGVGHAGGFVGGVRFGLFAPPVFVTPPVIVHQPAVIVGAPTFQHATFGASYGAGCPTQNFGAVYGATGGCGNATFGASYGAGGCGNANLGAGLYGAGNGNRFGFEFRGGHRH
jgi:hypothetical protein